MALAVVLLAGGGWWVVRAPMVDKPQAKVPEADLDAMALHAEIGRSAGLLMRVPASPSGAAAAGAASGAFGASEHEASCGTDNGPKYADPVWDGGTYTVVQIKGASPAVIATQARIDAALRGSADPFYRAVADAVNAGDARTPAGRVDALVQQAVATSDPRVYSLAMSVCESARMRVEFHLQAGALPVSCSALSARRWAALDPDNGFPWLWVLAQASQAKDDASSQDALAHLAAARRFDRHSGEIAGALASHVAAVDANEGTVFVMTLGATVDAPLGLPAGGAGLPDVCRNRAGGNALHSAQCEAITAAMFDNTDSLLMRRWAGTLTTHYNGDDSRREAALAETKTLMARLSAATPDEMCAAHRFQMKRLLRSAQNGELAALRELAASAPAKP